MKTQSTKLLAFLTRHGLSLPTEWSHSPKLLAFSARGALPSSAMWSRFAKLLGLRDRDVIRSRHGDASGHYSSRGYLLWSIEEFSKLRPYLPFEAVYGIVGRKPAKFARGRHKEKKGVFKRSSKSNLCIPSSGGYPC